MKTQHKRVVEANGIKGEVYRNSVGVDLVDTERDAYGWEQISPTMRVFVESIDIGGHQRWWVWRRVEN